MDGLDKRTKTRPTTLSARRFLVSIEGPETASRTTKKGRGSRGFTEGTTRGKGEGCVQQNRAGKEGDEGTRKEQDKTVGGWWWWSLPLRWTEGQKRQRDRKNGQDAQRRPDRNKRERERERERGEGRALGQRKMGRGAVSQALPPLPPLLSLPLCEEDVEEEDGEDEEEEEEDGEDCCGCESGEEGGEEDGEERREEEEPLGEEDEEGGAEEEMMEAMTGVVATSTGVASSSLRASGERPASRRRWTMSSWPEQAARWRSELPSSSRRLAMEGWRERMAWRESKESLRTASIAALPSMMVSAKGSAP